MNFKDWTTIEEHLAVLFVILMPESVVRANADPAFESSGRNALMTRSRQTKPAPESKAFSFERGMHDFLIVISTAMTSSIFFITATLGVTGVPNDAMHSPSIS